MTAIKPSELKNHLKGFSRRDFVKYLFAGSAVSLYSLNMLNAAVYQSITSLNQKYIQDESPDGVYWDAVSKHFLFQDGLIMMNNGTVGPMPEPVFNTLIKCFKLQVTNPFDCYNFIPKKKEEVRAKLALFINASPDEVVMTRNTTEGMNFVANGLDLKEGDEVLLSSMEHPAGTHPWKLKEKRYGIKIKEVPLGLPPKSVHEIVNAFQKAITPRTKIISISHTVYISGLMSPLKELSKMAHEKGVLVVADSAHGIGIASSGWDSRESARKYETLGQRADALAVALGEAVDFQNAIGRERIERRIKALAGYLKKELKKIPGVKLHTSQDPYLSGGLTAFSVEGIEPEKMVNYLREKYNIVIRTIGNRKAGTYGVRASTHIYVSFKHINMLLEGIKHLVRRRS
jgi:selenocysteine lyase/cysteine desulfurase